jgi:hypothetical protein
VGMEKYMRNLQRLYGTYTVDVGFPEIKSKLAQNQVTREASV